MGALEQLVLHELESAMWRNYMADVLYVIGRGLQLSESVQSFSQIVPFDRHPAQKDERSAEEIKKNLLERLKGVNA